MTTPIADTHVHLWDPSRLHYGWHEVVTAMNRPFLLDDYRQATRDVPIERMVFVQCDCDADQNRDEVAMITELAEQEPRLQGIVAFAPLEQGAAVESQLAWLGAQPLVKGIRRITQGEPDDAFCLRDDFVAGTRLLAKHDLTCDLCITYQQLPAVTQLVEQCPDVRFILDHLGKPDIKAGHFEPWAAQIKRFAAVPNTWCKLSGVVTEADHQNWTIADIAPFVRHTLDCFGSDRVLFGGDWPVVTLACDYITWRQTVESLIAEQLLADERQAVMHDNAVTFYRLPD